MITPMPAPASSTATGLAPPRRPATTEGNPKMPLPRVQLIASATMLQRPMTRSSCGLREGWWLIAPLYHKAGDRPCTVAGSLSAALGRGGRHHGQQEARGVRRVEIDRVLGDAPAAVVVQWLAGVGIDVEARKVTAGDVEPDAVGALEEGRGRVHIG